MQLQQATFVNVAQAIFGYQRSIIRIFKMHYSLESLQLSHQLLSWPCTMRENSYPLFGLPHE